MNAGSTRKPKSLSAIKAQVRAHYRAVREAKMPKEIQNDSTALCRQLAGWKPVTGEVKLIKSIFHTQNNSKLPHFFPALML